MQQKYLPLVLATIAGVNAIEVGVPGSPVSITAAGVTV